MGKFRVVYTESQIRKRVLSIGKALSQDYKDVVLIGVLNGSFVFVSDLIRVMDIDCEVDFIKVKSYEDNKSTGKISLLGDLSLDIKNKHVVIVEDIIDSGKTITYIHSKISKLNPKSIEVASLLLNPNSNFNLNVKYVGFEDSFGFLIGYGLDYNQRLRGLTELFVEEE